LWRRNEPDKLDERVEVVDDALIKPVERRSVFAAQLGIGRYSRKKGRSERGMICSRVWGPGVVPIDTICWPFEDPAAGTGRRSQSSSIGWRNSAPLARVRGRQLDRDEFVSLVLEVDESPRPKAAAGGGEEDVAEDFLQVVA
jgi:hypothetical protein